MTSFMILSVTIGLAPILETPTALTEVSPEVEQENSSIKDTSANSGAPTFPRKKLLQCLDLLEEPKEQSRSGAGMGRVLWEGQVLEPVLAWPDADGYKFRSCLGTESLEISVEEAEFFDSALVARFQHETLGVLNKYHHRGGLEYVPDGEVELRLRSSVQLLEAQRVPGQHVEVVTTSSVGRAQDHHSILLIARRTELEGMRLGIWDEPWGIYDEDYKIKRDVHWWELVEVGELRAHQAVGSFAELSDLLATPAGGSTRWPNVLNEYGDEIFSGSTYLLMILSKAEQIDLAEALSTRAEEVGTATLDIARLEDGSRWSKKDVKRMEGAKARGQFWSLGRLLDLATLLPERIADEARKGHIVTGDSTGNPANTFSKENVILLADSSQLQIGNAIYRDQIPAMLRTASFLECVLDDETHGPSEVAGVFEEGLKKLNLAGKNWTGEENVDTAFHLLFSGLNLPSRVPVSSQLFESGIYRRSPEILELVRLLRAAIEDITLEERASCDIAMLPESLWGGLLEHPLEVIPPSLYHRTRRSSRVFHDAIRDPHVQEARDAVRLKLQDLLLEEGAKYAREEMILGYVALDRGNELLFERRGQFDKATMNEAITHLRTAEQVFDSALEIAAGSGSRPRARVH